MPVYNTTFNGSTFVFQNNRMEKNFQQLLSSVAFCFLLLDKQQVLWHGDRPCAGVQRYQSGTAAGSGEPRRTEVSARTQHKESHLVSQDCSHQLPC